MSGWARLAMAVGAAAAALTPAAGYYHYIQYLNRFGPSNPIMAKFDLNALPGKTVTFFVSDAGPSQFGANDSFPSVLSQIRQAAQVWNSVETSDLRVAFGGLYSSGALQLTPGGEVVFEEMPPGLLAFAGPTSRADATAGVNGPFVPITRAVVHLNRDLTRRPGPSYLESFFTTVVHEMGHALGLQHTFTSSAMSTAVTRATSRARPLDADDIAGLSLLYPRAGFTAQFGSISGRITSGGQGVHLASVVALRPTGPAVSTLTNPDGTYRIDGLAPGNYWVYVHPLPPTAWSDLNLPIDASGQPVQPNLTAFETLFYPGTREPQQFETVAVQRGGTIGGIDMSVQPRQAVPIYDVVMYSFSGQTAISPAFLNASAGRGTVVARGPGLTSGANAAAGLSVQVLGGIGPAAVRAYGAPQTNLALDVTPGAAGTGPRHLLFSLPNDAYVLPAGVQIVERQPPVVNTVSALPDGTVLVAGSGMGPDSAVYFDGLPATVRTPFAGTDGSGAIVVAPPPGAGGQRATITVYNSDGQNSMFLQAQSPPTYTYDPADPPSAVFSPAALPAGVSAMVEITGIGLRFADGRTTIGFGSSDVAVRQLWVLSSTRAIANVTVAPNAPAGPLLASAISGFQVASQPFGFQVQPANPRGPSLALPLVNAVPGQTKIYPGALASVFGSNLALGPNNVTILIADQPAPILFASPGQINFQIPDGLAPGPAVLRLNNGAESAWPVVAQIEAAPPVIMGAVNATNLPVDGNRPARAGDVISLLVSGVNPAVLPFPDRVRISIGGVEVTPLLMFPSVSQSSLVQIQFVLPQGIAGNQVPITVSVDGSGSIPIVIPVR